MVDLTHKLTKEQSKVILDLLSDLFRGQCAYQDNLCVVNNWKPSCVSMGMRYNRKIVIRCVNFGEKK